MLLLRAIALLIDNMFYHCRFDYFFMPPHAFVYVLLIDIFHAMSGYAILQRCITDAAFHTLRCRRFYVAVAMRIS